MFIFGTMIVYGVYMTTKVSGCLNDLVFKGQGQIYFISILWLVSRAPLTFLCRLFIFSTIISYVL